MTDWEGGGEDRVEMSRVDVCVLDEGKLDRERQTEARAGSRRETMAAIVPALLC